MKLSMFLVFFYPGLVISFTENSHMVDPINLQGKYWCIAAPVASNEALQSFLDRTCGTFNCKEIQPGGSCFNPNTYQNHASYALTLFYRARGACPFGTGTLTSIDPCKFKLYISSLSSLGFLD
ncbi:hypothetical protein ACS0TY_032941 [Phlomoides rotata]